MATPSKTPLRDLNRDAVGHTPSTNAQKENKGKWARFRSRISNRHNPYSRKSNKENKIPAFSNQASKENNLLPFDKDSRPVLLPNVPLFPRREVLTSSSSGSSKAPVAPVHPLTVQNPGNPNSSGDPSSNLALQDEKSVQRFTKMLQSIPPILLTNRNSLDAFIREEKSNSSNTKDSQCENVCPGIPFASDNKQMGQLASPSQAKNKNTFSASISIRKNANISLSTTMATRKCQDYIADTEKDPSTPLKKKRTSVESRGESAEGEDRRVPGCSVPGIKSSLLAPRQWPALIRNRSHKRKHVSTKGKSSVNAMQMLFPDNHLPNIIIDPRKSAPRDSHGPVLDSNRPALDSNRPDFNSVDLPNEKVTSVVKDIELVSNAKGSASDMNQIPSIQNVQSSPNAQDLTEERFKKDNETSHQNSGLPKAHVSVASPEGASCGTEDACDGSSMPSSGRIVSPTSPVAGHPKSYKDYSDLSHDLHQHRHSLASQSTVSKVSIQGKRAASVSSSDLDKPIPVIQLNGQSSDAELNTDESDANETTMFGQLVDKDSKAGDGGGLRRSSSGRSVKAFMKRTWSLRKRKVQNQDYRNTSSYADDVEHLVNRPNTIQSLALNATGLSPTRSQSKPESLSGTTGKSSKSSPSLRDIAASNVLFSLSLPASKEPASTSSHSPTLRVNSRQNIEHRKKVVSMTTELPSAAVMDADNVDSASGCQSPKVISSELKSQIQSSLLQWPALPDQERLSPTMVKHRDSSSRSSIGRPLSAESLQQVSPGKQDIWEESKQSKGKASEKSKTDMNKADNSKNSKDKMAAKHGKDKTPDKSKHGKDKAEKSKPGTEKTVLKSRKPSASGPKRAASQDERTIVPVNDGKPKSVHIDRSSNGSRVPSSLELGATVPEAATLTNGASGESGHYESAAEDLENEAQDTFGELGSVPPQAQDTFGELGSVPPQAQDTFGELGSVPPQAQDTFGELGSVPPQAQDTFGELGSVPPTVNLQDTFGELGSVPPTVNLQDTFGELGSVPPTVNLRFVKKKEALVSGCDVHQKLNRRMSTPHPIKSRVKPDIDVGCHGDKKCLGVLRKCPSDPGPLGSASLVPNISDLTRPLSLYGSDQDLTRSTSEDRSSSRRRRTVFAEALWDHVTMEPDELAFRACDVIEVVDTGDKDWWWGRKGEVSGCFPSTFVRLRAHQEETTEELFDRLKGPISNMAAVPRSSERHLASTIRGRCNVLREILSAERDYTRHLGDVIQGYLYRARKLPQLFDSEQLTVIFSNLEDLYSLAEAFLKRLQLTIAADGPNEILVRTEVGNIFVESSPLFEIYSKYCSNHPRANQLLQLLRQDPRYVEFFKVCGIDQNMGGIPLEGFLLTPIQKICKYPLQLRELLKYTPSDHPDNEPLSRALHSMMATAELVNERKRRLENIGKIHEWQQSVIDWQGEDILCRSTMLLHSGDLGKSSSGSGRIHDRVFFLFDHQLIQCRKELLSIRHTVAYKARYNLDQMQVGDLTKGNKDHPSIKNGIELINMEDPSNSLLLVAKTASDKEAWLTAFKRERDLVEADKKNGFLVTDEMKNMALSISPIPGLSRTSTKKRQQQLSRKGATDDLRKRLRTSFKKSKAIP